MKKVFVGVIVGLLAGIGMYAYAKNKGATEESTNIVIDLEKDIEEGRISF